MPQVAIVETPQEQAARVAHPDETNGGWLDRYTLVHASSGAAAQRLGLSFGTTVALAVAFEFGERSAKRRFPEMFPNPTQDSGPNMIGDVVAAAVGRQLSRALGKRRGRRR